MKSNEFKIINIAFSTVAALTVTVGTGFSFLIAHLQDAPGMVIFGSTAALAAAAFIYGLGQLIIVFRKSQETLSEISRKLTEKADKS